MIIKVKLKTWNNYIGCIKGVIKLLTYYPSFFTIVNVLCLTEKNLDVNTPHSEELEVTIKRR